MEVTWYVTPHAAKRMHGFLKSDSSILYQSLSSILKYSCYKTFSVIDIVLVCHSINLFCSYLFKSYKKIPSYK